MLYLRLPKAYCDNCRNVRLIWIMDNRARQVFRILAATIGIVLAYSSIAAAKTTLPPDNKEIAVMPMTITSPSFKHDGDIPVRHTCDGLNISPKIEWSCIPAGTKSLVLIVDDPDAPDPDAPRMTWVHWVVYNIPADTNGLPETYTTEGLHSGTMLGFNDWNRAGYQGPCPLIGKHRYYFKLYALDIVLPDLKNPEKTALEKAMKGHILAHSELLGRCQRK